MNDMDLYYRALKRYGESVAKDKAHTRFMQALAKAPARNDKLETIRTKCIIEEDWVAAIEKYLPFVEKAIREDRQFIRQEGEIVPIEKAKKVSKASVSHLARHSDFITHLPEEEGEPLLPDKLYITENDSNYAVYENRFLYMLLCYTRDFVELRFTKISELGNTYRGALKISKHVELGKRTITFDATLTDVAKNDPYSVADRATNEIIERLEAIRVQVLALLMTPLMNEVSKAPMLRPPITRTNVLRMDNNFKNAVALYDYLAAYEGDGYTIEEIKRSFAPFPDKMGAEFFGAIPVLTHLSYKYGNELESELKEHYDKEETAAALREAKRRARELEDLRKKLSEGDETMEQYILRLESYVNKLEESIDLMQREEKKTEARINRLRDEIAWQKNVETGLREDLAALDEKHEQLAASAAAERIAHTEEAEKLRRETAEAMAENDRLCETRIRELQEQHAGECSALQAELATAGESLAAKEEENLAMSARFRAYQAKHGDTMDVDLTEKDNFEQLEQEREWFEKLFKETWGETKKRIRLELLWKKFASRSNAKGKAPDAQTPTEVTPATEDAPTAESTPDTNDE